MTYVAHLYGLKAYSSDVERKRYTRFPKSTTPVRTMRKTPVEVKGRSEAENAASRRTNLNSLLSACFGERQQKGRMRSAELRGATRSEQEQITGVKQRYKPGRPRSTSSRRRRQGSGVHRLLARGTALPTAIGASGQNSCATTPFPLRALPRSFFHGKERARNHSADVFTIVLFFRISRRFYFFRLSS